MKTAEQLFPHWKKALETGEYDPDFHCNIESYEGCIVGEAHGWNNYNCEKCNSFAIRFWDWIAGFIIVNNDVYNDIESDFVEHWNKEHEK